MADKLYEDEIDDFKDRYDEIINVGLAKNPSAGASGVKKRGIVK